MPPTSRNSRYDRRDGRTPRARPRDTAVGPGLRRPIGRRITIGSDRRQDDVGLRPRGGFRARSSGADQKTFRRENEAGSVPGTCRPFEPERYAPRPEIHTRHLSRPVFALSGPRTGARARRSCLAYGRVRDRVASVRRFFFEFEIARSVRRQVAPSRSRRRTRRSVGLDERCRKSKSKRISEIRNFRRLPYYYTRYRTRV